MYKNDTKEFTYEFVGWDKKLTAFYKDEKVYAVYNAIPKKYNYKFLEDDGETIVRNAEDLRNKESDRIKCLVEELSKIGIRIEERQDGFIISGKESIEGGAELESYHDHRLAMSYYIAGLIAKNEIAINGFEWTKISFPEFEELFSKLTLK